MKLTLAHLSDVHLAPLHGLGPGHINLKRALGLANWMLKRRKVHLRSAVDALVADLALQRTDHIIVSGDLANLGLPGEHAAALDWLKTLGPPERVSVVPGNHDIYCPLWRDPGVERWRAYMTSCSPGLAFGQEGTAGGFPFIRIFGRLAIVGVNSAVPTRPFSAIGRVGDAQLDALGKTLGKLGREGFTRVVVIHHPPLPGQADTSRGLTDAARMEDVLLGHGAELVVHGHNHRDMHAVRRGPKGPIHVVGVASASVGRTYKEEPLARYNLIHIEPATGSGAIAIESRGLASPGGPVVALGRLELARDNNHSGASSTRDQK